MRFYRLIAVICAVLCAHLAFAAPSVLQTNVHLAGGSSSTSIEISDMPDTLTSGSTLVIAISFETQTVSAVSVSDNKNGAYTADANSGALAGSSGTGGGRILFFHVANTYAGAGSGLQITATWTTGSAAIMSAYEVSGLASSPFDTAATAKTGTGSLESLDYSITPSGSGEFVVAVGLAGGSTGISVDSGYTFPTGDQGAGSMPIGGIIDYHAHEYAASVSGAQSLSFNGTSASGASMYAAAYKAAGASGPPKSQMFFGAFNLATPEWQAPSAVLLPGFSGAGRTEVRPPQEWP